MAQKTSFDWPYPVVASFQLINSASGTRAREVGALVAQCDAVDIDETKKIGILELIEYELLW